jgi:hypothetical protein
MCNETNEQARKLLMTQAENLRLREALQTLKPTIERLMYEAEGSYGKNFSGERAEQARKNYRLVQETLYITKSSDHTALKGKK